jgi:cytoskeletal protein RodZ
MPRHWSPNFAIIAFMVVMGAVIFAWVYSISFSQEPVASTVPPAIPTVTPIPDDRLALPSPTAIPTATATAAVPPTATAVPSAATSTSLAQPAGVAPQPTPVVNLLEPTAAPAAEQQPAAVPGSATVRVIAQGDIQVTVEADGAIVFSGWLGSGSSTEFFSAANFAVTTSDGSLTLFENAATGQQFYMGYGQNETYYLGG